MHKQFQKFGLFVSKNTHDEAPTKLADKNIKYLYKKEAGTTETSKRRKIKSGNESKPASPKHSKKNSEEDKQRSHKRKSKESLEVKYKRREPQRKKHESETEIFFISPEEIKKHRSKPRSPKESLPLKLPEASKKRSKHRESSADTKRTPKKDDIVKYVKESKNKPSPDYEWLTKKEIYKLINSAKETPRNDTTNFLKKFFVFDKHDNFPETAPFSSTNDKHSKKIRQGDDIISVTCISKTPTIGNARRRNEKISKLEDRKSRDPSIDVMYTRDSKKQHRSKPHDDHSGGKHDVNLQIDVPLKKKKIRIGNDSKFVFDELKFLPKEAATPKMSTKISKRNKESPLKSPSETKIKAKGKIDKVKECKVPEKVKEKLEAKSRVNPSRHKHCLVKDTFAVVEISPSECADTLDKKKKLKAFKKYYKYHTADQESAISSTYHTFSDSHKFYDEMSVTDMSKKASSVVRKMLSIQEPYLTLHTHVSTVIIPEAPEFRQHKTSNDDEKANKRVKSQKSKIPVWSNCSKIVELAKDSLPVSKARRKSADLFSSKFLVDKNVERPQTATRLQKEKVVEKRFVSRPSSARSSVTDRPSSAKPPRPHSVPTKLKEIVPVVDKGDKGKKSAPPKVSRKESKVSGASSRMSSPDRKSESRRFQSNVSKDRALSPVTPPTCRRQSTDNTHRGNYSPPRLSNDGTSSVWSRSSKRTNKTSLASKSETKLSGNKVTERRFKSGSAQSSLSNSTFGDKSVDSSRNTTSFLLTKSFKDEEKLNRWHKRKLYADTVRRNAISKSHKTSALPTQVLEVRFLTITNPFPTIQRTKTQSGIVSLPAIMPESPPAAIKPHGDDNVHETKDFFENDLPDPCFQLIENKKFKELFESPTITALEEILNENNNFLKKDFSFISDIGKSSSSDDLSSEDLSYSLQTNDWFDFQMGDTLSLSEISCCRKKSSTGIDQNLTLGSQDHIIDSLSAPGSEESGYATINSRPLSRTFFEQPEIKALLKPHFDAPADSYRVEVQIEDSSSSTCAMEIRSIESKSIQTTIEYSQKSVQIKMSQEKVVELIHKNNEVDKKDSSESVMESESSILKKILWRNRVVGDANNREEVCLEEPLKENKGEIERAENVYEGIDIFSRNIIEFVEQYENCEPIVTNEIVKEINKSQKRKIKKRKKDTKFKHYLFCLLCVRRVSSDE